MRNEPPHPRPLRHPRRALPLAHLRPIATLPSDRSCLPDRALAAVERMPGMTLNLPINPFSPTALIAPKLNRPPPPIGKPAIGVTRRPDANNAPSAPGGAFIRDEN